MKQCDIVVSATSAPHMVVKQEYYTPEKQVTFLDLATPRDIDPKLSDDSKVNLINLDTIKEISKANQSEREELCRQSNTKKQFVLCRKNVQRSWKIVIHIYQEK